MTTMAAVSETFTITEEIMVRATLDTTFASLIAQMGRLNESPDGKPLPMVLEPRPGGRWYRELGGDNGHLWGFVQSIKRPVLLEMTREGSCRADEPAIMADRRFHCPLRHRQRDPPPRTGLCIAARAWNRTAALLRSELTHATIHAGA